MSLREVSGSGPVVQLLSEANSEVCAAPRDALIGVSVRSWEALPELLLEETFCFGQDSCSVQASAEAGCFSGPDHTPGL